VIRHDSTRNERSSGSSGDIAGYYLLIGGVAVIALILAIVGIKTGYG
jgi:hypothetical protein